MGTDKHLTLRATPNSALGRVLTHLQNGPIDQKVLATETLLVRYLPFVIDKDDPQFREIAIRCANECEAWGRAIREYAELGIFPSFPSVPMGQLNYPQNNSIPNQDDELSEEEEIDPELEERKRQRREDDMGF